MRLTLPRRRIRSALALLALALAGLAFAVSADADAKHQGAGERLVVRGEDTVVDAPCGGGLCLTLSGGSFHGAPVGAGAYTGSLKVDLTEAFDNGEHGVCAPVAGHVVLGPGSPDRLDLALWGDSCQDGAGDPTQSSFTGLARFAVVHGTGAYATATGGGIGTFLEDASDHEHVTLIGRIAR